MVRRSHDRETLTPRMPVAAWLSVLSLDAVLVAVAWQQLLMLSFCDRGATWAECGSLAATVWLVYVADRLLDAARLDLSQPHTLRHRFYLRHRRVFFAGWVVVLLADTLVVVRYLSPELLRSGLVLASAVLVYGAGVHFPSASLDAKGALLRTRLRPALIPKEFRVGVLFALGVSLTAWTSLIFHGDSGEDRQVFFSLAAATVAMAVLFGVNCVLVARFERHLDRAQSFASIATRWQSRGEREMQLSLCVFAIVVTLPMVMMMLQLPASVGTAVAACALGLFVLAFVSDRRCWQPVTMEVQQTTQDTFTFFDVRGVWVDVILWTPPMVILCCM